MRVDPKSMAFPYKYPTGNENVWSNGECGMTIRTWLAGQALAHARNCFVSAENTAETAVKIADEVLRLLNQE